ncbi:MAG: hypothetical protein ABFD64_08060 [Armatimonadota bacterium]
MRYVVVVIVVVALVLGLITFQHSLQSKLMQKVIWTVPSGEYGCDVACTSPDSFAVLTHSKDCSLLREIKCSGAVTSKVILPGDEIYFIAGANGRYVAVNQSELSALCVDMKSSKVHSLGKGVLFDFGISGNAYPISPYGPYALLAVEKDRVLRVVNYETGATERDIAEVENNLGEYIRWQQGSNKLIWLDPKTCILHYEKGSTVAGLSKQITETGKMEVVLSPDAKKAAVFPKGQLPGIDISIIDVKTSRILTKLHESIDNCCIQCVRWSPDSSTIAISLLNSKFQGVPFFYILRAGGKKTMVSLRNGWCFYGVYSAFDWFDDSKRLVLSAYRNYGKQNAVVLVDMDRHP